MDQVTPRRPAFLLMEGGPLGLLGTDKGKRGKYLVLPPGYKDKVPAGYIPLQSDTLGNYMLFRANFKSHADADVQTSISYDKRMKVYPLSAAAQTPSGTDVNKANNTRSKQPKAKSTGISASALRQ
jgi:hypothetical protein